MNEETRKLMEKAKYRLRGVYGDRLRGLVLFGSESRGEAEPDSDLDILILLDGPINLWQDISAITDTLYPLQLEINRPLSAIPADFKAYEAQDRSLYRTAKREGIEV